MQASLSLWRRIAACLGGLLVALCLTESSLGQTQSSRLQAESAAVSAPAGVISETNTLSAELSDPRALGWMQGFPPPLERRITQPFTQFWPFPKLRWSVCHMRELLPTAAVRRHVSDLALLPVALDPDLRQLPVPQLGTAERQPLHQMLDQTYTDGLLVLNKGRVVYEYYNGCLTPSGEHATMSMTKSVLGLLIEILIAQGVLDDQQQVTDWIPELKDSAFAGASLRDALNMATAVAFDEDYANPESDLWRYARATDALPKPADYTGVTGNLEFLTTLETVSGEHGEQFHYSTVNSDVIGWVASRATNAAAAQLFSDVIWQVIGAQQDAALKVDAYGIGYVGGGLQANMRDLGRLGLALLNAANADDASTFASAARTILFGSDGAVAVRGPNATYWDGYRSFWWYRGAESQIVAARGVHGQILYIDSSTDTIIVRFASSPHAGNAKTDPVMIPIYEAINAYLSR